MAGVRTGSVRLTLVVAIAWAPLAAQSALTLEEAGARHASAEFRPAHLNESVRVRGVVNAPAFHFPDYALLAIEDGSYGAVLKVDERDHTVVDVYHVGDDLQVEGTIAAFMGMPVIVPERLGKLGVKPAPAPVKVSIRDLTGFRYLGRLVRTEASVQDIGDTANGAYLSLDSRDRFLAFLPRTAGDPNVVRGLAKGDSVRITGIAYQYCSRPPF